MTSRCRIVICLFRNDLRYLDNEALQWAHRNADKIVPLYCFDPRHFKGTYHFGFPKTGPFRTKFLIESVRDLRNTLNKHGSGLVVRHGHPETVIAELIQQLSAQGTVTTIALQQEVTSEELSVETGLKSECKVPLHTVWGHTLNHLQDVPFNPRQVPDVYTQFRKRVEGAAPIRALVTMPDRLHPLPEGVEEGVIPSHADLGIPEVVADSRSAFPFHGGETEALSRLEYYLWSSDNVAKYKETRNGMVGHDYSTKFSPWLAHGCISPRQIYWEIKRYEEQRTSNQSTYWVIFELLWRDYFKFVALKYGNKLFFKDGILGKQIPWKQDKLQFAAWKEGRTGVPYVDANMREMAATGFMSNRGRQNVASFLTKDLGLDWRLGAEWFESQLVDHDVCSNYGNWLYSAGLGNDPRENRKFNMIKQGLDYDPEGEYVRLWVPELSTMPGGQVHTVWMAGKGLLARAGISLGETYPNPIVVAPEWSRHHGKAKSGTSRGASAHGKGGRQRGIDFYFKK